MAADSAPARDLGDLNWNDVETPVVLVPIGSFEQHGPHLPLTTDTVVATALSEITAERLRALVAPAIGITASGEHAGFPGTLSIGTNAFTSVLVELIRSADWVDRLVLVNGHGGNRAAVDTAISTAHHEGRRWASAWWPRRPETATVSGGEARSDLHAGWIETSVMLHLRPDLVADPSEWPAACHPDLDAIRRDGVRPHSPTGVIGDPSGATAERGAEIVAEWADDLVAHVTAELRA